MLKAVAGISEENRWKSEEKDILSLITARYVRFAMSRRNSSRKSSDIRHGGKICSRFCKPQDPRLEASSEMSNASVDMNASSE